MKIREQSPGLQVGICSNEQLSFSLNSPFKTGEKDSLITGRCDAVYSGSRILLMQNEIELANGSNFLLTPLHTDLASFTIHAVTIGVNFHWQREEDQVFKGGLRLIVEDNKVTAVNVLSIEDYLTSVTFPFSYEG